MAAPPSAPTTSSSGPCSRGKESHDHTDFSGLKLEALAALTRDYAAFQSRKSGLATALGGLMAVVLVIAALSPNFMGAHVFDRLFIEYLVWVPFLWLAVKGLGGRILYRGLGIVKASPDGTYERRRWFWILGLALFLITVLLAALYAFASGFLQANQPRAALRPPPMWILLMPFLYLLLTPWAIRGIEEARAYAVLVGQCILWLIPLSPLQFRPPDTSTEDRVGALRRHHRRLPPHSHLHGVDLGRPGHRPGLEGTPRVPGPPAGTPPGILIGLAHWFFAPETE